MAGTNISKRRKRFLLILLVITILLTFFLLIQVMYLTHTTTTVTSAEETTTSEIKTTSIKFLTYIKKGGVKGVYNVLEIHELNEAVYTCIFSPRFGNMSFPLSLNKSEVDLLFKKIVEEYKILEYSGRVYEPKHIYDYFTYEVFLELEDGNTIKVKWVDEWASKEPIPENLIHIKETLENFIRQKTIPCE